MSGIIDEVTIGDCRLILGDTLEKMAMLDSDSIDMICCDLPYGTTACKWDTVIPFEPLWEQYKRVIKQNGAIVLFGSQPFTSALVMSNPAWFKYGLIWEKSKASNFLHVRKQFAKVHEDVLVFYCNQPVYNPQMTSGVPYSGDKRAGKLGSSSASNAVGVPNPLFRRGSENGERFPRSVQYFKTSESEGICKHPTQKPVALCEYLIRTYTNEGETVLDNTMGSGTTGVACVNTKRKFVGIERDDAYFKVATKRIEEVTNPMQASML